MNALGAVMMLLALGGSPGARHKAKGHGQTPRQRAEHLVEALFDRNHAQITSLQRECVTIVEPDEISGRYVEFELHEKHDATCGGDPEVAPRITTIKVDLNTGKGTRSDPVTGEEVPLK